METMCPVCLKRIDIPERQAVAGAQPRCQECWALLRCMHVRPFRVVPEAELQLVAARTQGTSNSKGDEHA